MQYLVRKEKERLVANVNRLLEGQFEGQQLFGPKSLKASFHTKTCTANVQTALFIIFGLGKKEGLDVIT